MKTQTFRRLRGLHACCLPCPAKLRKIYTLHTSALYVCIALLGFAVEICIKTFLVVMFAKSNLINNNQNIFQIIRIGLKKCSSKKEKKHPKKIFTKSNKNMSTNTFSLQIFINDIVHKHLSYNFLNIIIGFC